MATLATATKHRYGASDPISIPLTPHTLQLQTMKTEVNAALQVADPLQRTPGLPQLGQSLTLNKDSELGISTAQATITAATVASMLDCGIGKNDDPALPIVGLAPSSYSTLFHSATPQPHTETDYIYMMLDQAASIFNTRAFECSERTINFQEFSTFSLIDAFGIIDVTDVRRRPVLNHSDLCAQAFKCSKGPTRLARPLVCLSVLIDIGYLLLSPFLTLVEPPSASNSWGETTDIESTSTDLCLCLWPGAAGCPYFPVTAPGRASADSRMASNGQQLRTQLGGDCLVPEQGINGFAQQEVTGPTARISGHKWNHRPPPLVLTLSNPVLDKWMISTYSASCSSSSSSDSLPPETPVGFEFSGRGNEPLTLPNLDLQVDSDSLFLSDLTSMDNHPTEFSDVLSGESQTLTGPSKSTIPSQPELSCWALCQVDSKSARESEETRELAYKPYSSRRPLEPD
ncbi:hypothetical protein B0F90DRAFT_1918440 [Multifurca ochricompacta]|uniref:Uncharacterized protein n=1 Tax=Multifurca ochricompacta TaxID=376703 RepID=A0AAD4M1H1_9AGAM|nr:hypothetical protein B0F90DRAFT_1918440 [Multifurca ochricompacta]